MPRASDYLAFSNSGRLHPIFSFLAFLFKWINFQYVDGFVSRKTGFSTLSFQ